MNEILFADALRERRVQRDDVFGFAIAGPGAERALQIVSQRADQGDAPRLRGEREEGLLPTEAFFNSTKDRSAAFFASATPSGCNMALRSRFSSA